MSVDPRREALYVLGQGQIEAVRGGIVIGVALEPNVFVRRIEVQRAVVMEDALHVVMADDGPQGRSVSVTYPVLAGHAVSLWEPQVPFFTGDACADGGGTFVALAHDYGGRDLVRMGAFQPPVSLMVVYGQRGQPGRLVCQVIG